MPAALSIQGGLSGSQDTQVVFNLTGFFGAWKDLLFAYTDTPTQPATYAAHAAAAIRDDSDFDGWAITSVNKQPGVQTITVAGVMFHTGIVAGDTLWFQVFPSNNPAAVPIATAPSQLAYP